MKKRVYLSVGLLFVINTFTVFPQQDEPIIVSPLIGEELDRVERGYFHLFPKIEGFKKATFYLNPDSTLRVKIVYEIEGWLQDTVLNNYKSPRKMKNYIDQFLTYVVSDIEPGFRGKFGDLMLIDSSKVSGELLAVRDSSVLVYGMSEESYESREIVLFNVSSLQENDIRNISFTSKTNISMIVFGIAGMVAGSIIGYTIVKPESEDTFWEKAMDVSIDMGKIWGLLGGLLIGSTAGIILGLLIPIETESETVFETPLNEKDIEGLRENARYQNEEPYYLQKIK
jgi:hypothetical protein